MTSKYVVRKSTVMSRREKFVFGLLVAIGLVAIINYAVWWIQPGHVPTGIVGHILYLALSLSIWTATLQ